MSHLVYIYGNYGNNYGSKIQAFAYFYSVVRKIAESATNVYVIIKSSKTEILFCILRFYKYMQIFK